jgi:hypothetical protein
LREHNSPDTWMAERGIILQLLRDDRDRWTRGELRRALSDLPAQNVNAALTRLEQEGVAVLLNRQVLASRCALHLDSLGTVSI